MADVQRRPLLRHLRSAPTTYVRHLNRGKVAHEGVGIAFWFRPLSAVISEVPVDDRELPMLFHGRSADFQDVSVQATVTYRIAEPAVAAQRIDFAVSPDNGQWRGTPLDQVAAMLTETAQQHALRVLAGLRVREAVVAGPDAVRAELVSHLAGDERLAATGIGVVDVRVVAVRPEAELERALQTPAREEVQQEADRATFERRALAVERERAIAENEMQSRIELAHREENLVAQRNQNARRTAEGAAEAALVEAGSRAERDRLAAELAAETTRVGAAAAAERVRVVGAAEAEALAAPV
ncbi:SPFH domain-containing protein, partial [Actinocorallia longicatena]|uniref:SPFH domain-containing protein n=1 Tax=Actinocorallia longicatena TaxID=111803 RepID=UPI0031D1BC86